MDMDLLTEKILGAAILVHRELGPGLLESAYEPCVGYELTSRGLSVERQKKLPLRYKGIWIDCSYRLDMVVEGKVILEFKCAAKIDPIHEAQMLTYLRLSKLSVGLILNFNTIVLKDGIRRIVNQFQDQPRRSRRLGGD